MQPRMNHPAMILPGAMQALHALSAATEKAGLSARTLELVHLRASQINGCSVCLDMHSQALRKHGETDERLFTVAAWRDAPYFTEAERAALALAEAVTRLSDQADPCLMTSGRRPRVTTMKRRLRHCCWPLRPSTSGTG